MAARPRPIAVFDSGVGGLTVLRALVSLLPREHFIYVGDTARVPYGSKSAESVKRFSIEVARFFRRKNVKMMVTACNTVSALALPELRAFMPVPVLGVIEPGARAALAATRTGRVGIIGTEATVQSRAYERAVQRLDGTIRVFSRACPLFVPLVEEGQVVGVLNAESEGIRLGEADLRLLRQIADLHAPRNRDRPAVRRHLVVDELEQRRLSRPVRTDKPHVFAGIQLQRNIVQDDAPAELLRDILYANQTHRCNFNSRARNR